MFVSLADRPRKRRSLTAPRQGAGVRLPQTEARARDTIHAPHRRSPVRNGRVMEERERRRSFSGPGGTPGGLGEFFIGVLMALAAVYMLTSQVTVSGGYWHIMGHDAMGLSLVPLVVGIGLLFFNGKSPAGWLLLAAGLVIIVSGIVMNLRFYFQPTSLFNTLIMLGLLAGGLGLLARGLQGH